MSVVVVGLSHRTAPLELLERMAMRDERLPKALGDLVAEPVPTGFTVAKFDLNLKLTETPDGALDGVLTYATALFDESTARRLSAHFVRLLAEGVAEPDRPQSALEMFDPAELAELTDVFATGDELEVTAPVHEQVARRNPNALAIVDGASEPVYRS